MTTPKRRPKDSRCETFNGSSAPKERSLRVSEIIGKDREGVLVVPTRIRRVES